MKGISPIIAIIIILLITIAIAGAAYSYISIIWGRTTEGIQLISSDCSGTTVSLTVRNVGTTALASADITVTRTSPTGAPTIQKPSSIAPGAMDTINDTACVAGAMCVYRVMAKGQSQELYAQC